MSPSGITVSPAAVARSGGTLRARRLQLDGAKKLPAGEFAAAAALRAGARLGDGAVGAGSRQR